MSRLARAISESGVYHILFRGVNQQNIFEESSDFEKLKETIALPKNVRPQSVFVVLGSKTFVSF